MKNAVFAPSFGDTFSRHFGFGFVSCLLLYLLAASQFNWHAIDQINNHLVLTTDQTCRFTPLHHTVMGFENEASAAPAQQERLEQETVVDLPPANASPAGTLQRFLAASEEAAARPVAKRLRAEEEAAVAGPGPDYQQQQPLSEERFRLGNAFRYLKPKDALARLQAALDDPHKLYALGLLFPLDEFPPPLPKLTCLRCKKQYEPNYETNHCRMNHPTESIWGEKGYKGVYELSCLKCGGARWRGWDPEPDLGGPGTPTGDSDDEGKGKKTSRVFWFCGECDGEDDGEPGWCYSGPHEPTDQAKVDAEEWDKERRF